MPALLRRGFEWSFGGLQSGVESVKEAECGLQQLVVVLVLGLQAANNHFDARSFVKWNAADVDVVDELGESRQNGLLVQAEALRNNLKGDHVAHVREGRPIEVVAQR